MTITSTVSVDGRYRPLYIETALEPGEWRDLPNGRQFWIRCVDCRELLAGESATGDRFVPGHLCVRRSAV